MYSAAPAPPPAPNWPKPAGRTHAHTFLLTAHPATASTGDSGAIHVQLNRSVSLAVVTRMSKVMHTSVKRQECARCHCSAPRVVEKGPTPCWNEGREWAR